MTILRPPDRPRVTARHETFPLDKEFAPGRGQAAAHVVTVEINEGTTRGRGECVPDASAGETPETVIATIEELAPSIETGVVTRRILQKTLPPGAARNALDCAIWDFDSKRGASSVWQMAGLDMPHRVVTAFTIPLDTPAAMAAMAVDHAHRPLLKLRLGGGEEPMMRLEAVRRAVPRARLIVAADESWTAGELTSYLPLLEAAEVELIEQPLPADDDGALVGIAHRIPFCATRACTAGDLDALVDRYEAVTIKLDRTGGLTAALELQEAAREAGFRILVSCAIGSSLGVAPALMAAQDADWVDLDAPLTLARDRQPGLRFDGSVVYPPNVSLWG